MPPHPVHRFPSCAGPRRPRLRPRRPPARAWRIALALALVTVPASGCSLLFVKGPPAGHERMDVFTCTDTDTFPILDLMWSGLNALSVATTLARSDERQRDYYDRSREAAVGLGVAWSALTGYSAYTGFSRVRACRAALEPRAEAGATAVAPSGRGGPAASAAALGWRPPQLPRRAGPADPDAPRGPLGPLGSLGPPRPGDGTGQGFAPPALDSVGAPEGSF